MCGIVGLHLREPSLYPQLGALLTGMLGQVTERGPDSAGVAVYGDPRWSPAGQPGLAARLPPTPQTELARRRCVAAVPDATVAERLARRWSCTRPSASTPWSPPSAPRVPRPLVIGSGDEPDRPQGRRPPHRARRPVRAAAGAAAGRASRTPGWPPSPP